jgi:hypothetical protein
MVIAPRAEVVFLVPRRASDRHRIPGFFRAQRSELAVY